MNLNITYVIPRYMIAGNMCLTRKAITGIDTRYHIKWSWWRQQRETFFASRALSAGNSPVTGEFPSQMPVTESFDVFFDLRLNKMLSKQSRRRWFETLLRWLWRQCNVLVTATHRTSAGEYLLVSCGTRSQNDSRWILKMQFTKLVAIDPAVLCAYKAGIK